MASPYETHVGHTTINPSRLLHLTNVLVSPSLIKNLVSVRQFTKENSCSLEFDPFGLNNLLDEIF